MQATLFKIKGASISPIRRLMIWLRPIKVMRI